MLFSCQSYFEARYVELQKKTCFQFCHLGFTYNTVQETRRFGLRKIQKAEYFTMIQNWLTDKTLHAFKTQIVK